MKIIGNIISFAVKLALVASIVVVALEVIDRLRGENSSRYLFTEDFND